MTGPYWLYSQALAHWTPRYWLPVYRGRDWWLVEREVER